MMMKTHAKKVAGGATPDGDEVAGGPGLRERTRQNSHKGLSRSLPHTLGLREMEGVEGGVEEVLVPVVEGSMNERKPILSRLLRLPRMVAAPCAAGGVGAARLLLLQWAVSCLPQ